MYFVWRHSYCQFLNKEGLKCVRRFVTLQVASLCCCRTGYCNCTHRVLLKVKEGFFCLFFFAHKTVFYNTSILGLYIYASGMLCVQRKTLQKWHSWNADFESTQHSSIEIKTDRAIIRLTCILFLSLPYSNQMNMYKAKYNRWDTVTSHWDLITLSSQCF